MKEKLILCFPWAERTIIFSKELEERYFPPGTPSNEKFELAVYPNVFCITVPDTPQNRSAISVIAHKYGIAPSQLLTKFDEYMELFYQGKISDMRNKICQDVFNYVEKHFGLKNPENIIQVFCNERIWKELGEKWGKKFFLDTTMATVAHNYTFDPLTGAVYPKDGYHLILLNAQAFDKLSAQDKVFNHILTLFHELVHISGVKDDVKVYMLELKFSKAFLGIHHSKEDVRKKYREVKEFLAGSTLKKARRR